MKPKPNVDSLVFGKYFTDHMLEMHWDAEKGWTKPSISPLHDLKIHPAAKVLHYAIEVWSDQNCFKASPIYCSYVLQLFEGMKAYRGVDGRLRLFRPDRNMDRMYNSAIRSSLPSFDKQELVKCIKRLITIEQDWVPNTSSSSLYIRPTFIATDVSFTRQVESWRFAIVNLRLVSCIAAFLGGC